MGKLVAVFEHKISTFYMARELYSIESLFQIHRYSNKNLASNSNRKLIYLNTRSIGLYN